MGKKRGLVDYSIIFIAVVVLVLVLRELQAFLRPFIIAIVLTFLMMPHLREFKSKRLTLPLFVAGAVTAFLAVIVFLALILQGAPIDQTGPSQQKAVEQAFVKLQLLASEFTVAGIELDATAFINPQKAGELIAQAARLVIKTARALFTEVFLVFLFFAFLVPSHAIMIRDIEKRLGKSRAKGFKSVVFDIEHSVNSYLVTKTLISLGTALVSGLFLYAFGNPFVLLLALLFFIFNFVPNIGSFAAVALALLTQAIFVGLDAHIIFLALLLIATQILFGSILEPKIAGRRLRLSPIVILLGLFFWGWVWGVMGMLLAVPLTSIIKIVLEHIESTKTIAHAMS